MAKAIKLVSSDIELHSRLTNTGLFEKVDISEDLNDIYSYDVVIISDRVLSFNKFLEAYENSLKDTAHLFYMVSDTVDNISNVRTILKSKGVNIIPPKLTTNQVIDRMRMELGDSIAEHKNIVALFGADSKVGTSVTAQGIAETLVKGIKGTVLLMFLNGQPSDDYLNIDARYTVGLDSIKIKLINNVLTPNELIDTCIKKDSLYVLVGSENILGARYYHPEQIDFLIKLASDNFSAVIIDAGCRLSLGMSIGALNSTANKYLVTTQQETSRRNFDRINTQLFSKLGMDVKDYMVIVNKHINTTELYTPAQIAELYGSTLVGALPYLDYGWQAESDRKSLTHFNVAEYNAQMVNITKVIASQLNLDFEGVAATNKSLLGGVFSWFKK